jgi:hypothetical protein
MQAKKVTPFKISESISSILLPPIACLKCHAYNNHRTGIAIIAQNAV